MQGLYEQTYHGRAFPFKKCRSEVLRAICGGEHVPHKTVIERSDEILQRNLDPEVSYVTCTYARIMGLNYGFDRVPVWLGGMDGDTFVCWLQSRYPRQPLVAFRKQILRWKADFDRCRAVLAQRGSPSARYARIIGAWIRCGCHFANSRRYKYPMPVARDMSIPADASAIMKVSKLGEWEVGWMLATAPAVLYGPMDDTANMRDMFRDLKLLHDLHAQAVFSKLLDGPALVETAENLTRFLQRNTTKAGPLKGITFFNSPRIVYSLSTDAEIWTGGRPLTWQDLRDVSTALNDQVAKQ